MNIILITILALCNILNAKVEFSHRSNNFSTHQPVLYEIANATTGAIIEFGSGQGSTDLLHAICKKTKRLLVTIDDDLNWLNLYRQKYLGDGYNEENTGWHKFFYVPGKVNDSNYNHWLDFLNNFDLLKQINFDLCFIDQSPFRARTETILHLKDKVKYIILHDCDYFAQNNESQIAKEIKPLDSQNYIAGIYDFSSVFKNFKVYFPHKPWAGHTGPPTLLGSNFESNLPEIDFNNY
ncbi:MAG: hypothetical protein P4L22_00455 [Candidatus Babeliales bacterium]|nr:hypothetical protein [Candidatus Babeliales bacterium]